MVTALLLTQTNGLTETQRAIRDQFEQGGSVTAVLLVLLALAALVLGMHYLTQRQRADDHRSGRAQPGRLFRNLLHRLNLTRPQRQLLELLTKDLRLKQPTVILLSQVLFDRYAQEWHTGRYLGGAGADKESQLTLIAEIRAVLYPSS